MKKFLLFSILVLMLTSCASIINGGKARVSFDTKPDNGTMIFVNGVEKGQTPLLLKVKAGDLIRFEKEGFAAQTIEVDAKFNTVAVLNLFSILGWGIDALTESLKVPDTRVYSITLKEKN